MAPEEQPLGGDDTALVQESEADNITLDDFKAKIGYEPGGVAANEPLAPVAEPDEPQTERHRPRKQRARAGDVPRIAELTRRLRETEAERDALKGGAAPASAAVVAAPAVPGNTAVSPPPRTVAPLPPVKAAATDPEPDAQAYDDLTKWMRDHSRWAAREELRAAHAEQATQAQAETQRSEAARIETQWKAGVTEAKAAYPDFEAVAFAPTRIPKGSLIDGWILEHKFGPSVLYHLQKHQPELDAMLALPLFEQVEALTLLTQRLSGARTAAVTTPAAPAPMVQPVTRPPTGVRTNAMRPSDDPPDPENATLSEHVGFYGTPRSRRVRH